MKISALLVATSLMLACCTACAQEPARYAAPKPITIIGDSIRQPSAIFLGEVHAIYEGDAFKFQLIRWAYQRYGIRNVVMEMGKSDAYLFNQYFQKGDTTILDANGHDAETLQRLKQWESLYRDTKCTLWGIDFEREPYVLSIRGILKNNPAAQKTQLYDYLNRLANDLDGEDDEANRKKHIGNYEKARSIFREEQTQLKALLGDDYRVVEEIMLNPATERKMKKRDEAMTQNLMQQLGNTPFICIVGAGHTNFDDNTLLKRYAKEKGNKGILLINMLCKNCYNTSYYGSVVSPLAGDFKDKDESYFSGVCDKYCKEGVFTLIDQRALTSFPSAFYPVTTFYALFKDQPKW
jgi:hypothetical protein